MCVTSGAGTAYLSGALEFIPWFWCGSCCSIFGLVCSVLQIVVCTFILFLSAIAVSVLLQFTNSDYPFVIFKLLYSNVLGTMFVKRKLMVNNSNNTIYHQNEQPPLTSTTQDMTTTDCVENTHSGFGKAQNCGGAKTFY